MNGNDTFLDIRDAHLRVTSGNVYASAFNLDQIDIVMSSNTASTVNFNNPTKAFNAASNIEVGTANLFVDTTTSNVGIGTDTPLDTLHINGGTRFAGHIIPTTNATFDIGEPENKIRDIYVDTNSLWIGDITKIAFERGKMKFKRRKINKVPTALVTLATSHVSELNTEAEVQADAVTFAQTIDNTISAVEDLKLEHWRDYAKRFDETKAVSDIFIDNDEDYEAVTASEAFMEVDSNIFTEHSLSIGKTTDPTSALDVVGTVKATAFEGDGSALTGIVSGQWTESGGDIYRSSGNVGVGTDSPAKTLHVAGTMRISNATTNTETTDIVKIASTTTTTTTTTPFTGWSQEAEVYASNRSSYDYFGQNGAVSGDGSTFVSIARNEDSFYGDSGAAYVFTYNGSGGWPQTTMLKASDRYSSDILGESGISISHDATRIVVGSPKDDDTYTNSGSAYIFDLISGTWTQVAKLVASNPGENDYFGRVKISGDGNSVFVGAYAENGATDTQDNAGALYYFTKVNGSWGQRQLLRPSTTNANDYFGLVCSCSYDGTRLAVCSRGYNSSTGAVFIFELQGGTWTQVQMIQASNGEASDYFGASLDMSYDGNTVVVAAHHESGPTNATSDSGALYVFERSESGTFTETAILRANNLGAGDNLGGKVNISGNGLYIVAGARNEDTPHGNAGSVYVFRKDGTTWSQVAMLSNTDTSGGDLFGDSVGISEDGEIIAGGAVLDDVTYTDTGSAYIFRGTGAVTTTTTTTIPSSLKINDTIVATAFEGDGSALTGIVSGQWTESSGNIYRSSGNVGIGIDPSSSAKFQVSGGKVIFGDVGGYGDAVQDAQVTIGGTHNSSTYYNTDNQVKLLITGGDNDSYSPYYIKCEDENGRDQFYLKGATSDGGTSGIVYTKGRIGVNTTSPHVPIHVVGGFGSLSSAYCIYAKSNDAAYSRQFHLQSSMGWNNLSIYASDDIVTGQYLVSHLGTLSSSDERIKENIVDVDDASALELFRLLKPKKYQYIDKIKRGDDTVFGFIAQDVEKTMPHGTRKVEQTIPNIMEIGTVTETNIITLSNFNTSDLQSNIHTLELHDKEAKPILVTIEDVIDEHSIRVDKDLSEFLYEYDENGNDITESVTITESEYNALEDVSGYIYNENAKTYTKILTNKIFVYGERIDNFLKLNKDTIWTVSTAALQEVDRQQQADKARITELESQLTAVLARLDALENA